MKTGIREQKIISILESRGEMSVSALSEYLGVSVEDIMPDDVAAPVASQGAKKALTKTGDRELDMSLIKRLVQLTPDEMEKVDAFVQGLLASRQG